MLDAVASTGAAAYRRGAVVLRVLSVSSHRFVVRELAVLRREPTADLRQRLGHGGVLHELAVSVIGEDRPAAVTAGQ